MKRSQVRAWRQWVAVMGVVGFSLAAVQAGCGSDAGPDSTFVDPNAEGGGSSSGASGSSGGFGSSGTSGTSGGASDADPDALGTLVVTPASATIAVTIVDGAVTVNAPVTFSASYSGAPVAAEWLFDRGELGSIASTGVFKANGTNVGEGTITARFGAREGTAKVKVTVTRSQNGIPAGSPTGPGGFGGLGGVGGEPLGPAVDAPTGTKLKTTGTAPANAAELGFLYPYDKTVFPRGILPPLLMWQSTHEATAVYVKLSQAGYTYEGTFSYAGVAAGAARRRVRLDESVWKAITQGNSGDPLLVEVKVLDPNGTVYGPIKESFSIAPGVLKGTVYYNSYDSLITTGGGAPTGGVIAIRPSSPDPSLAVPSQAGKCHVCHTLSADGSTLWAQDSEGGDYATGSSYDLTKATPTRTVYPATGPGGVAGNNRKFVWSAPYPDGSFALASSRYAREAYTQGDSKLFARGTGAEVASTGLGGVVASAVTPTFAPDGRKVAFNFWEGTGAGTVTAGAGRSLAVLDFTCGAGPGSTTCAPGTPKAFAGLREIYRNAATYPSWPTFLPDGKAVVFNNQVAGGDCSAGAPDRTSIYNCELTTWFNARSELWVAKDGAVVDARSLANANGVGLPTNADHPNDSQVNFQPTVNPVPSGGYYWVVFTSRRIYGNLLTGKPYGETGSDSTPQKKLWVAAIDVNAPAGTDPSHAAFYLPGQELGAGNSRGFWVVDPCKQNGNSCETGDECCNGFCRAPGDGGALVCSDKPPGTTCVKEFEKCSVDGDCCDPAQKCIAGKCSKTTPTGPK
ncbi:MAG: hypothetical protein JWP97_4902 [Labilithrix sp.]|nr:hypothetical protein [Labilithrix sp.]